jgi:hypothetical protein
MLVQREFEGKVYSYDYSPEEILEIRKELKRFRKKKYFEFFWYPEEKKTKQTIDELSDRQLLEDFNVGVVNSDGTPDREFFALYIPTNKFFKDRRGIKRRFYECALNREERIKESS